MLGGVTDAALSGATGAGEDTVLSGVTVCLSFCRRGRSAERGHLSVVFIIWQGVDAGVRGVARSDEIGDNACRNPANKRTCEMSKLAKHVKCRKGLKRQGTVWAFSPKSVLIKNKKHPFEACFASSWARRVFQTSRA